MEGGEADAALAGLPSLDLAGAQVRQQQILRQQRLQSVPLGVLGHEVKQPFFSPSDDLADGECVFTLRTCPLLFT